MRLYGTLPILLLPTFIISQLFFGRAQQPIPGTTASVPQCRQVSLEAAYLASVSASSGAGFLLTVANDTDAPITLMQPVPTSAHWYAESSGGRWMWRASTGAGGGLVNALQEKGPVFAYKAAEDTHPASVNVPAHGRSTWTALMRDNPALLFRPGCQRCKNPEDKQYRAILAYAYLPAPTQSKAGLLACGLRSNLIVMPPLQ